MHRWGGIEAGRGNVAETLHSGHAAHCHRGQAPGTGTGSEPGGHLALHQEHAALWWELHLEEPGQQRRGDAVRDVAGGQPPLPHPERRWLNAQGIALDHGDIGAIALCGPRRGNAEFIHVHRDHAARPLRQFARQGADPGADLEHVVVRSRVERGHDVVENLPVHEEVLAHPPAGHQSHPSGHRVQRSRVAEVGACRRRVAHRRVPGRPKTRCAVAVDCSRTVSGSTPRRAATAAAVAAT